jgi:hypothetical protein
MVSWRIRKSSLFALTLLAAITGSASGFAGSGGWFTQTRPGIACKTENPNMIANWARLLNVDPNTQGAWCPLDSDSAAPWGSIAPSDVEVDVTPGWANTQSCTLAELTGPNSGYFFGVSNIAHNGSWDSIEFHGVNNAMLSSEVECSVPSGQAIYRYAARIFQEYDWTSW